MNSTQELLKSLVAQQAETNRKLDEIMSCISGPYSPPKIEATINVELQILVDRVIRNNKRNYGA